MLASARAGEVAEGAWPHSHSAQVPTEHGMLAHAAAGASCCILSTASLPGLQSQPLCFAECQLHTRPVVKEMLGILACEFFILQ